jgi:hypothetical protein
LESRELIEKIIRIKTKANFLNKMSTKKEDILKHSEAGGQIDLDSLEALKKLYVEFERPSVRIVIDDNNSFISFKSIPKITFKVSAIENETDFAFIEDSIIVSLQAKSHKFLFFVLDEFWQGKNFLSRLFHFISTIMICSFFTFLLLKFGSEKNLQFIFSGILSSISIFIAVFSIFLANSDIYRGKELQLFEKGKLSYYYSVDRNITLAGVIAIIFSLFGLVIVGDDTKSLLLKINIKQFSDYFSRECILLYLALLSFFFLFIILRSLIQFYVNRPGRFLLGDIKGKFLKHF